MQFRSAFDRTFPSVLLVLALAIPALSSGRASAEANGVDDFRVKLGKWVETRRILSEEETDWQADKEILKVSRDLLLQQRKALGEEITELEASATSADEERRDLLLRRAEYQRAAAALEDRIRGMEREVLALAEQLPEPLRKKLELLLVQIPEDPEVGGQPLGQRLMNVLGVLAQAEKWNGTATLVAETRPIDGEKVQVRTLYWGLSHAIYVDAMGRTAGVGTPGADGWEFTNDPNLAADATRLLDIYEGNVDVIEFVELPVEIH